MSSGSEMDKVNFQLRMIPCVPSHQDLIQVVREMVLRAHYKFSLIPVFRVSLPVREIQNPFPPKSALAKNWARARKIIPLTTWDIGTGKRLNS
jgi:hypothetical protein